MAIGDVKETGTDVVGGGGGSVSVTYASATPVSGDLNVACYFTGATSAPATPSGYTEAAKLTDSVDNDEGVLWYQEVAGAGDDNISVGDAGDEAMLILTLFEGPVISPSEDLAQGSTGTSTSDPVNTGVSSSSTAQDDELLVGIVTARDGTDQTGVDSSNRQGTASPTTALLDTGTQGRPQKRVYQNHQVLTTSGTVGISRENSLNAKLMVGYATFKLDVAVEVTTPPTPENTLTAAEGAANLGDKSLSIRITPPGASEPMGGLVQSISDQGAASAPLTAVIIDPAAIPKVLRKSR